MLFLEFNTINLIAVLIVAHFCNLFGMWSIHFLLHKKVFGIPFYLLHLKAHHRIDYLSDYKLNYLTLIEHMIWGMLILAYSALYYWLFTTWIVGAFVIEGLISTLLTYYVHLQYETKESWLSKYAWFVTGRKLHLIHHRYRPSSGSYESFIASKNYAFGGPITGNIMDHLAGTYEPVKPL
ncbi:MAG: sterol desaturase family protein [Candidatus Parabeggiatoa sp.]|nr:sterol desaturase family protein [Candidatus Parabeggiatoa sp.]